MGRHIFIALILIELTIGNQKCTNLQLMAGDIDAGLMMIHGASLSLSHAAPDPGFSVAMPHVRIVRDGIPRNLDTPDSWDGAGIKMKNYLLLYEV